MAVNAEDVVWVVVRFSAPSPRRVPLFGPSTTGPVVVLLFGQRYVAKGGKCEAASSTECRWSGRPPETKDIGFAGLQLPSSTTGQWQSSLPVQTRPEASVRVRVAEQIERGGSGLACHCREQINAVSCEVSWLTYGLSCISSNKVRLP